MRDALIFLKQGSELANRNIKLYIPIFILSVVSQLNSLSLIKNSTFANFALAFIIILLLGTYSLSIWLFFNDILEKKQISVNYAIKSITKLLLRFSIAFIVLVVLIFVLLVFLGTILILSKVLILDPQTVSYKSFPVYINLFISLISPLFIYTGIFFAIRNKFFIFAMIKSAQFAMKNLKMSYLLTPYFIIIGILNIYVISPSNSMILGILYITLYSYVGFVITATYLLFFRSKNK